MREGLSTSCWNSSEKKNRTGHRAKKIDFKILLNVNGSEFEVMLFDSSLCTDNCDDHTQQRYVIAFGKCDNAVATSLLSATITARDNKEEWLSLIKKSKELRMVLLL